MSAPKRVPVKERVAKGLCPKCGAEAAPYYLCGKCRLTRRVARAMERASKDGSIKAEGEGRERTYSIGTGQIDNRWQTKLVTDPEKDRRFAPRLRGVPVDLEAEIMGIFRSIGRPCSVEEIVQAWGRLRESRKRGSLASDVRALVEAERKRQARAAKALAQQRKGNARDA